MRFWLLAVVVVLGACTAPSGGGPQCTFDTDCEQPLICATGFCRAACMTNADCPSGGICHQDINSTRRVCIAPGSPVPCRYASDCSANEICTRDGQCRPQCVADYDCRVTNPFTTCVEGQVCRVVCAQGRGNCDEDDRNGCEVDTATETAHCGACGTSCPVRPNARATCESGRCAIACEAPFADCDNDPANGCEEDLSQPTNCGACGTRCAPPTPLCSPATGSEGPRYRCAAVCAPPSPDLCAGVCTDRTMDPRHCGRCDNACPSGAASAAVCASGTCGLRCEPGAGDCDGDASNGCEVTLASAASHCGACGATCPSGANATATCADSRCALVCETGFANCDLDDRNGCEVDTRNDPGHCGACSTQCERPSNGAATCADSRCGVSCGDGYADCDRSQMNGCETDTRGDVANCGACGARCAPPNAAGACAAGRCGVARCTQGFEDCDGDAANGCEVDTRSSPAHCGRCGNACPSTNGSASCSAGACVIACAAGFGDCDGNSANGCETDTRVNSSNCGACGAVCSFPNAGARCNAGRCESTRVCSPTTRGDCDGNAANGCETDLLTAAPNCGACGAACNLPNATATCAGGRCGVAACNAGFADCDGNPANGCEVDTRANASHCGRCGAACSTANGAASCRSGACAIVCSAGYGDCDGSVANGCETNTNTAVAHCGRCGGACNLPNAVASCGSGRCAIAACNAGFGDCDGNAANGCEVDLRATPAHCGGCGRACATTNGAASCAMGACGIACIAGFGNCDGNVANGCETSTNTSTTHCGACGRGCSVANGAPTCSGGRCAVGSCNPGFGDCDGSATNGCETATSTSTSHCGACGRACSLPNATAACVSGACAVGSCNAGFGDCDNNPANGCETDTRSSNAHCGRCGGACTTGMLCSSGACGNVCGTGLTFCAGQCFDTRTDPAHCGGCGAACPARANATPTCGGGMCSFRCNTGFGDCDGNPANGCEANLGTATAHCGACGNACNATNGAATCSAGACGINCSAGFGNCDGNAANGCEVDTRTTVAHCGMCGRGCSVANGVAGCAAGACTVASCNGAFGDCDSNAANGCETNTAATAAHCGRCGNACNGTNGTPSCSGGACGISCSAGFGNCDGDASNGCETSTNGDVNHCGACGARCSLPNAVPGCSGGRCVVLSCATNWGDCDGNAANGCETNLLTTPAHCGRCGGACSVPNATPACTSGACTVGACNAGFGNCDGNAANGCETSTTSSAAHCGACGNACTVPNATPACTGGACTVGTCNAGFGNCDGNGSNGCETSTSTSAAHCGACGNACGTGFFCASGVCTLNCGTLTNCSNVCVDTTTNPAHCGGCGAACPPRANAGATCSRSVCGFACNAGFGNCDGNATNGCETSTNTSAAHCGACNATCAPTNATGLCAAGVCGVGSCNVGWGNCDGNPANGCETNTNGSVGNCGACGNACSLANATPVCTAGACAIGACLTGFGNCDNNASNGCETNTSTSASNCGACGTACTYANASAVCVSARCGLGTCNAGWGNCDQNSANGCELNLTNNVANCGACGNLCPRVGGGAATCVNSVCGYVCGVGYYDTGTGCALIQAPRPVFPMSTSRVTSQRPTLRWAAAAAPVDGVRLQVCSDRACANVLVQQDLTGTAYTLATTLTAGPYFWRLYGRVGTQVGAVASPVWEFFVGVRTATRSTARDTVPDFNGDGIADVVVGAPNTDRVYVYYGSTSGPPTTASLTLAGGSSGGRFGSTVSSAGDVNGDGFGDLLVAESTTERVHVFLGGSTGLSTARTTISDINSGGFGVSASWAGDTNGDGYGDIVVGANRASRALAYHGSATGISTSAARIYSSTQPGFGTLVRGVGTVNDDDLSDIMVSSATGWSSFLGTLTTATTYAPLANIRDIHTAGDVNGDGRSDIIVATWLFRTGMNALHVTRVYHGTASGASSSAARTYTEAGVSNSAAAAGVEDVNNDGFGDVAVSAQGSVVHVYYGSATGAGTTPTDIRVTRWADGADVAAAGDTNGDRRDDMIVGFPDSGCEFSGSFYARLYRGGTTAISITGTQFNAPDSQCSDYGVSVAYALPRALWRALLG